MAITSLRREDYPAHDGIPGQTILSSEEDSLEIRVDDGYLDITEHYRGGFILTVEDVELLISAWRQYHPAPRSDEEA